MDASRWAFVADKELVKGNAQWRNPELKSRVSTTHPSVVGGVDAAISAWAAEECSHRLNQGLTEAAETLHVDLARDARERVLNEWRQFKVSKTFEGRQSSKNCSQQKMGAPLGDGGWK